MTATRWETFAGGASAEETRALKAAVRACLAALHDPYGPHEATPLAQCPRQPCIDVRRLVFPAYVDYAWDGALGWTVALRDEGGEQVGCDDDHDFPVDLAHWPHSGAGQLLEALVAAFPASQVRRRDTGCTP